MHDVPAEDMPDADEDLAQALSRLLLSSTTLEPDQLPAAVRTVAQGLGASSVQVLLADHEQDVLCELAPPSGERGEQLDIDTTIQGRVFRMVEPMDRDSEGGGRRLLLPLLNGTHRIGVLEIAVPAAHPRRLEGWKAFTALVADLVVAKSAYGDIADVTSRRQPMALRAEAQRTLLPPLTLTSDRVLITGMLVPSYEVAGDTFDYALNDDTLHVAILDAMGHSLSATLTASVAVAAYRNTRREGGSLVDSWRRADGALGKEFDGERFTTAIIAELDLTTGVVQSVSAGHPTALVVRQHRVVSRCADDPTLPLGLGGETPTVTSTQLQPGDHLLLFTDGVVEARSKGGGFFGEERLVEQLGKELDSGLPPPEAVRRLIRKVSEHQDGNLGDDATLVLIEWSGGGRSPAAGPA